MPSPVSTRTRSKKGSASRYGSRSGDDDAVERLVDGDATVTQKFWKELSKSDAPSIQLNNESADDSVMFSDTMCYCETYLKKNDW